jgi:serine protease Do
MRKHILATIALLPLLATLSLAAQNWDINSWQPYGIPSEDSSTTSYLGVDIADVSADRLATLKLKEEKGVEVTMVDQDAPAGKAGIKEHDVILSLNGAAVESKSQLQRMIHETPAGRVVALGLSRDGQPITIKVQLADRRSEFQHIARSKDKDGDDEFHFEMPTMPNMDFDMPSVSVVVVQSSARSGLMVENLTQQLGEFFGAKDGKGVLVRSVERGSRADRAGLRAGDIIVRLGEQPVHDTSDFTHALHNRNAGSVNVEVIRDRKSQTLTIALPGRKESGGMLEESFDVPDVDAESRMEMTEVHNEVAQLRPQMELAREQTRKASAEIRKSLCDEQRQLREEARKLNEVYGPKVREELLRKTDELHKKMEQIRLEMSIHRLDI